MSAAVLDATEGAVGDRLSVGVTVAGDTVTAADVDVIVSPLVPTAVFSRVSDPAAFGVTIVPVPIAVVPSSQRRPVIVPFATVPSVAVNLVPTAQLDGEMEGFDSVGDGVGVTPTSTLTTFVQISTVGGAISIESAPSAVSRAPNTRPRKYRREPSE